MTIHAALMTGKGTGAISTIEIFGDSAESVMREIFKPAGAKPASFETGQVLLGTIADDAEVIDQVTLGCEGPGSFAIHCHGNPLIVEMIMELLRKHGASLVTAERLLAETLAAQESSNTIAIEARLAQANAKTVKGTRMIANQSGAGLTETVQRWLDGMDSISLDEIKAEAVRILHNSQAAKLIMYGCTAVLTGPPNSGKSTLLNYLAGRQKAIVTDIKGTTRDWVEAECQMGSLSVKLIDTAGLDEPTSETRQTDCRVGFSPPINGGGASPTLPDPEPPGIEQAAHRKTTELMEKADLVLLVLDSSQPTRELNSDLLDRISGKPVVTVLNKSDLPAQFGTEQLPEFLPQPVRISAKNGAGIDDLTQAVRRTSGTDGFDVHQPVCFTNRQEDLFRQLMRVSSQPQASSIITDLLNGRAQAGCVQLE